jgi:L-asparaginase/Glu-tRNA(Gln) amidotransferase subunit D
MRPRTKVTIVNTGGTICSRPTPNGRAVNEKFQQNLSARQKNVSRIISPYFINSENLELKHIFKLLDSLIKLIKNKKEKHIVVLHGTDAMDHVLRMISNPSPQTSDQRLNEKIKKLHTLIETRKAKIVFTGTNTTEPSEAKINTKLAIDTAVDSKRKAGIYLAFRDHPNDSSKPDNEFVFEGATVYKKNYQTSKIVGFQNGQEGIFDYNQVSHGELVYRLNEIRMQDHDLLTQILEQQPRTVKLVFFHSSTANVNKESNLNALDLIKKAKQQFPEVKFYGVTENGEEPDFGRYKGSEPFKYLLEQV